MFILENDKPKNFFDEYGTRLYKTPDGRIFYADIVDENNKKPNFKVITDKKYKGENPDRRQLFLTNKKSY